MFCIPLFSNWSRTGIDTHLVDVGRRGERNQNSQWVDGKRDRRTNGVRAFRQADSVPMCHTAKLKSCCVGSVCVCVHAHASVCVCVCVCI